jgi:putative acetyltransferase
LSAVITRAVEARDFVEVGALFAEHASLVDASPNARAAIERDVLQLPGPYVEPFGGVWLASVDGAVAGCAALKRFEGSIAELKRMFVRPRFRGQGIARRLLGRLIDEARIRAYESLRLGTLHEMTAARALYESAGFVEIPPYRPIELGDTLFYELALGAVAGPT